MNEEELLQEEMPVEDLPVEETPTETPAENIPVEVESTTTEEEGVTVNVTIQQPEAAPEDPEEALVEDDPVIETLPEVSTSFTVTSPSVLAIDESGESDPVMVEVITNILGEYQRQTYTVEQYDSSGDLIAVSTEYVPGLAGLDYAWIAGAVFFGIVLGACFKLLGGLIRS